MARHITIAELPKAFGLQLERIASEIESEHNAYRTACEKLCNAIKAFGQSQCNRDYDGPSIEFIEENWRDSTLKYLLDAYDIGIAALAKKQ
jgi:hypothetical protein